MFSPNILHSRNFPWRCSTIAAETGELGGWWAGRRDSKCSDTSTTTAEYMLDTPVNGTGLAKCWGFNQFQHGARTKARLTGTMSAAGFALNFRRHNAGSNTSTTEVSGTPHLEDSGETVTCSSSSLSFHPFVPSCRPSSPSCHPSSPSCHPSCRLDWNQTRSRRPRAFSPCRPSP